MKEIPVVDLVQLGNDDLLELVASPGKRPEFELDEIPDAALLKGLKGRCRT